MSLKCSNCGTELPEDSTVCPKCGTLVAFVSAEERDKKLKELASLLEIEEAPHEEVEPKLTEGPSAIHTKKENGRVGFTNGKVNGLSERTGFTNGRKKGIERRAYAERKWIVIALGVVLLVIASGFLVYFMLPHPAGKISVDGDFGDWDEVPRTMVSSSVPRDSIAPVELATFVEEKWVSFYVKVRGNIFSGSPQAMADRITDGCYILIDSDRSPETGYAALGYGFDYKITVFGEGGGVRSSALYAYEGTESRINWSAWKMVSSLRAANSGSQMEVQVGRNTASFGENFTAMLIMKSWDGIAAEPFLFSKNGMYLEVKVLPAAPLVLGDTPEFLKIEFCAKGGDASLNKISFKVLGDARNYTVSLGDGSKAIGSAEVSGDAAVSIDAGGYKLNKNAIVTIVLSGNLSGVAGGSTAGFRLDSASAIDASAAVLLRYPATSVGNFVGYYQAIPEIVDIDGAFGEWKEVEQEPARIANPNVDIKEHAVAFGTTLGMYVGVEGRIFNGEVVPERTPVIGTGGGTQQPPGYVSGEDILRVYLYTTLSYTSPDYMVEITGKDNEIRSSAFYTRANGTWVKLQNVNARVSEWQVEFEVPNVVKNTFFYVEMEFRDWNSSGVSRIILSPGVGEGVQVLVVIPLVLIATWVIYRKREERYD
ncbi:MAG: zinc ribbon domain-containing protein [Thermoplasmata archaeon]|nr:zinc ribbon domain-containing protein [Thermoplasmata archaeon]